ncbi:MAG: ribosome maturation factor RimM [Acidobacteriota bacterium]|jgi:16S rRNA processing protein RimM|nr:16S rRNA processing protein RimM [Acidobacteriota bacterium]MDQ3373606.1 ribosome maturation factor RimM [Acidobacteriota bacterium]
MEDLVTIAKIVKTRGLRGELVADILTDFPDRFDHLKKVFVVKPSGETLELEIEKFWFQKGRIIFKFVGLNSIEEAENFRDCGVCIAEDETVELEKDEFFDWQLTECAVETVDGENLGKVSELMRTGGTEILVVKGAEKDYLIPFAETICVEVDIENKLIKVDAPEGLLEF